jgi:hypothetical protein
MCNHKSDNPYRINIYFVYFSAVLYILIVFLGFEMPSWFDLLTLDASGPEDEAGIKKVGVGNHPFPRIFFLVRRASSTAFPWGLFIHEFWFQQQQEKEGGKICCPTFFVTSNFTKLKIVIFLNR